MMKDTRLLIRLKEYVNYASTAESNLAHYITEDPQAVIGKSIHELARLTYTSPSTIVRFCRKMGFQGYREFQQGLMYETALYHESRDVALQDITPKDSTRNVIRKVTSKNVESLRITEKLLDPKVVDACVELLTQCRLVALFGLGASLLAAQDLQLKLLRVDKLCYLAEDWHSQLLYARNLHPDDANRISPSCPMRQTRLTSLNSASDPKQPCKNPTAHRLFGIQAIGCGAFFIAFARQIFLSL